MKQLYTLFCLILLTGFGALAQEKIEANSTNTPEKEIAGFKLYPNPTYQDEVYITTKNASPKDVQVYNVFGKVVLKERLASNTLNIAALSPGIYVLRVQEKKCVSTRKLVVK